ncbi:MAG: histidinol-phosphatase [Clostridia bacterium]|nr:histidinol-phosphatase [Clostridia bacterium]
MLHNYHTHTKRCNHAQGEDREYVENAVKNGLKTLGFSDHAPYLFPNTDYQSSFRMKTDLLFEYAESVRSLAKEYEKDIRILCGFELEYYPDFHAEEMAFLKQVSPDYLIMGQHVLNSELTKWISPRSNEDWTLCMYVTEVLAGLATGDFLYLAHPDLSGYDYSEEVMQQEYRRLCEGAKRMHIPLELNFLGVRSNRHYPDRRFFKIAAEVGNDIVLGVDAHSPDIVFDPASEQTARQWADELGFHIVEKLL